MNSISPKNYLLCIFKLDNLNTLFSVLNIKTKVIGEIIKMCDNKRITNNEEKISTNLGCGCGCLGIKRSSALEEKKLELEYYKKSKEDT